MYKTIEKSLLFCYVCQMLFGGMENIMEYNEIHYVCQESNDAGTIYAGRSRTLRGNIIRYNYLHDISGFEGKGCVGVYLDDAFSGAEVTGNIFKNVTESVKIGGGRDNNVINNIFVDCAHSLEIDARGMGLMIDLHLHWVKEANEKSNFQLDPGSPAFSHGFIRIPFEKIGPYKSNERVSSPVKE